MEKMYQLQAQIFGVVFIQNHSLGVCIFDERRMEINCGQLLYFSYSDKDLLKDKLSNCSQVITNQPKNAIFLPIINKVNEFKGDLKDESISYILKELPFQNLNSIQNLDGYIKMMSEESECKFKSLGMLVYHLINNMAAFKRNKIYFDWIEYWNDYIFHHVQFTQTEVKFLELTTQHIHPSLVKTRVNNPMGSSIIKIYDSFLRTKGAKKYLKRIFLNPTYDIQQIEKRLSTIHWMIKSMSDKKYYTKIFNSIFAVNCIVERFQKDRTEKDDWRKLIKSLQSIIELRNSLSHQNQPQVVKELLQKDYWFILVKILNRLTKVIQTSPFGVKDSYNPKLKQLKRLYLQMPKILTQVTKKQNWSPELKLIFMPQIGYLVQIPHGIEIQQVNEWQLKFTNFNGKYYSNQLTVELDEKYGDINSTIQDIEKSIFNEMDQEINQNADQLIDVYWTVCQLECYWAISQISKNMTVPKMSEQELIIVNGWNMLLGKQAVENHMFSFHHQKGPKQRVFNSELNIVNTNYSNRCCVLSGPNGAGKTIYMKQLGIIVYLAHCGFYLPATFAQIPLTDRIIFVESSSSFYSENKGFKSQLNSLGKIMNRNVITSKSLVLIDQICLSQDFTIGLKILYASVNYLSNNSEAKFRKNSYLSKPTDFFTIPTTLIITHLTQLMANQLIQQNYHVRYLTMDVNNDFQFLFKVKPGLVKSGYGIRSAEGFMTDQKFIQRAYQYWKKLK